jgi:hypothetical protein
MVKITDSLDTCSVRREGGEYSGTKDLMKRWKERTQRKGTKIIMRSKSSEGGKTPTRNKGKILYSTWK